MPDGVSTCLPSDAEQRPIQALRAEQERRLAALLARIRGGSPFYTRKLSAAGVPHDTTIRIPDGLAQLPLTTKAELVADQEAYPPWGSVLSEPIEHYTRYSHTSGTTGRPLRWVDTPESWQWSLDCWKAVYRAARVDARDRVFFAFSFGPFYGFWTAFGAAEQIGAHCVPAGGMSSQQRLALLRAVQPSVVCCTPTYALRLAEVARDGPSAPLNRCGVRVLIVAGEPGGSILATRRLIEDAWGARVIDHHGLTEVGPVSFECWEAPGFLHLNEAEFICEVLDPETSQPVADGEIGELVITNLGRVANPVIRYRTGDLVVRNSSPCACGRTFARLAGGIRARVDDMVTVRGVNVYPAAIESIVRQFDEVAEFRTTVSQTGTLASISMDMECDPDAGDVALVAQRLADALRLGLGLAVDVNAVERGTLPRPDMKSSRFVIQERL
jgi:phenylacetate-CoA ligase